ncbi:DUF916 domain-containing protein [Cryobacterium levicorallinum]|uniref:DUF916 domain-containing protein n=1 Tax=Cryobacterium levicorallinum TaxID=995038 RepID=A0ABY1EGP0_9MICO|nr:DUF916 domain-containing protein [Cryobacterium levicorallinum]GEP27889.1 hypothetical protein CLE01_24870 [Cryobacterium levicorallinum]SFH78716.1 protein of unknown function [Cryobacterium levicorallinum]
MLPTFGRLPRTRRTERTARPLTILVVLLAAALLAPVGLALAMPQSAQAIDDGTLGIRPQLESDFFHIVLAPGAAIDATAIVSNYTDAAVTLLNYAVDGQSTPQGAFALAAQADTRAGVGAWVALDAEEITVPANSDLAVPFRLTVPVGTTPGDYAGGLIIQSPPVQGETTTGNGDAALRLDVIQRQGVRIYLTVDGTASATLAHGDLSWERSGDSITFALPITNTGNTILFPVTELSIDSAIGVNDSLSFNTPESILPGATLTLRAVLTELPLIQAGTARATLQSDAGAETVSTSLVYLPWWIIAVAVLVPLLLAFASWRTTRFIRRARQAIAQVARAEQGA